MTTFSASDFFDVPDEAEVDPLGLPPFRSAKLGDVFACAGERYEIKRVLGDHTVLGQKVGTKGRHWYFIESTGAGDVSIAVAAADLSRQSQQPILAHCDEREVTRQIVARAARRA